MTRRIWTKLQQLIVRWFRIAEAPAPPPKAGEVRLHMDAATGKARISEDGAPYQDLVGGGAVGLGTNEASWTVNLDGSPGSASLQLRADVVALRDYVAILDETAGEVTERLVQGATEQPLSKMMGSPGQVATTIMQRGARVWNGEAPGPNAATLEGFLNWIGVFLGAPFNLQSLRHLLESPGATDIQSLEVGDQGSNDARGAVFRLRSGDGAGTNLILAIDLLENIGDPNINITAHRGAPAPFAGPVDLTPAIGATGADLNVNPSGGGAADLVTPGGAGGTGRVTGAGGGAGSAAQFGGPGGNAELVAGPGGVTGGFGAGADGVANLKGREVVIQDRISGSVTKLVPIANGVIPSGESGRAWSESRALVQRAENQIVVGTLAVAAGAQADFQRVDGGLLTPRLTTAEKTALGAVADGMVVYDTTLARLELRSGGAWLGLQVIPTYHQEAVLTQNITGTDTALGDTLDAPPVSKASVLLFLNGQQMQKDFDYTVGGAGDQTITWLADTGTAPDMTTSDVLVAYYVSLT